MMEAKVTYRNRFPFQDDPNDMEIEIEQTGETFNEIEKEAVLWTPAGMYLHTIAIPEHSYTYTKEGKRTQNEPINN